MYSAIKDWIVQYILDYEPTQEQLAELNCDSYEEYIEPEETSDAKKIRIFSSLVASSDIESIDLEWVTFSNIEIGEIIQARVFGGNPHSESAFQAKVSAYIFSVMSGEPNDGLLISIKDKQERINDIRLKFGLTII